MGLAKDSRVWDPSSSLHKRWGAPLSRFHQKKNCEVVLVAHFTHSLGCQSQPVRSFFKAPTINHQHEILGVLPHRPCGRRLGQVRHQAVHREVCCCPYRRPRGWRGLLLVVPLSRTGNRDRDPDGDCHCGSYEHRNHRRGRHPNHPDHHHVRYLIMPCAHPGPGEANSETPATGALPPSSPSARNPRPTCPPRSSRSATMPRHASAAPAAASCPPRRPRRSSRR